MLRVFDAVARHVSLTRAAEELYLTQSAVSKQIKALEDCLGRVLFIRINRGVLLTPLGQSYLDDVRPLLSALELATEKAMDVRGVSKLTLHVFATLGERWLLERFPKFSESNPDIDVIFTAMLSSDGVKQLEIDGDFRYGNGQWPGCESTYLFGREMVLVCSPGLLARHPELLVQEQIFKFPWLQHYQVPHSWSELIESNPRLKRAAQQQHSPQAAMFEFYSVLIKAAVAGMGLAIVPRIWVKQEVANGQLINTMDMQVTSRFGYYFVNPDHKSELRALQAFKHWLLAEATESQRAS